MNLLDYMNYVAGDLLTKQQVAEVMAHGTEEEKREMWDKIMANGDYDDLED